MTLLEVTIGLKRLIVRKTIEKKIKLFPLILFPPWHYSYWNATYLSGGGGRQSDPHDGTRAQLALVESGAEPDHLCR